MVFIHQFFHVPPAIPDDVLTQNTRVLVNGEHGHFGPFRRRELAIAFQVAVAEPFRTDVHAGFEFVGVRMGFHPVHPHAQAIGVGAGFQFGGTGAVAQHPTQKVALKGNVGCSLELLFLFVFLLKIFGTERFAEILAARSHGILLEAARRFRYAVLNDWNPPGKNSIQPTVSTWVPPTRP